MFCHSNPVKTKHWKFNVITPFSAIKQHSIKCCFRKTTLLRKSHIYLQFWFWILKVVHFVENQTQEVSYLAADYCMCKNKFHFRLISWIFACIFDRFHIYSWCQKYVIFSTKYINIYLGVWIINEMFQRINIIKIFWISFCSMSSNNLIRSAIHKTRRHLKLVI